MQNNEKEVSLSKVPQLIPPEPTPEPIPEPEAEVGAERTKTIPDLIAPVAPLSIDMKVEAPLWEHKVPTRAERNKYASELKDVTASMNIVPESEAIITKDEAPVVDTNPLTWGETFLNLPAVATHGVARAYFSVGSMIRTGFSPGWDDEQYVGADGVMYIRRGTQDNGSIAASNLLNMGVRGVEAVTPQPVLDFVETSLPSFIPTHETFKDVQPRGVIQNIVGFGTGFAATGGFAAIPATAATKAAPVGLLVSKLLRAPDILRTAENAAALQRILLPTIARVSPVMANRVKDGIIASAIMHDAQGLGGLGGIYSELTGEQIDGMTSVLAIDDVHTRAQGMEAFARNTFIDVGISILGGLLFTSIRSGLRKTRGIDTKALPPLLAETDDLLKIAEVHYAEQLLPAIHANIEALGKENVKEAIQVTSDVILVQNQLRLDAYQAKLRYDRELKVSKPALESLDVLESRLTAHDYLATYNIESFLDNPEMARGLLSDATLVELAQLPRDRLDATSITEMFRNNSKQVIDEARGIRSLQLKNSVTEEQFREVLQMDFETFSIKLDEEILEKFYDVKYTNSNVKPLTPSELHDYILQSNGTRKTLTMLAADDSLSSAAQRELRSVGSNDVIADSFKRLFALSELNRVDMGNAQDSVVAYEAALKLEQEALVSTTNHARIFLSLSHNNPAIKEQLPLLGRLIDDVREGINNLTDELLFSEENRRGLFDDVFGDYNAATARVEQLQPLINRNIITTQEAFSQENILDELLVLESGLSDDVITNILSPRLSDLPPTELKSIIMKTRLSSTERQQFWEALTTAPDSPTRSGLLESQITNIKSFIKEAPNAPELSTASNLGIGLSPHKQTGRTLSEEFLDGYTAYKNSKEFHAATETLLSKSGGEASREAAFKDFGNIFGGTTDELNVIKARLDTAPEVIHITQYLKFRSKSIQSEFENHWLDTLAGKTFEESDILDIAEALQYVHAGDTLGVIAKQLTYFDGASLQAHNTTGDALSGISSQVFKARSLAAAANDASGLTANLDMKTLGKAVDALTDAEVIPPFAADRYAGEGMQIVTSSLEKATKSQQDNLNILRQQVTEILGGQESLQSLFKSLQDIRKNKALFKPNKINTIQDGIASYMLNNMLSSPTTSLAVAAGGVVTTGMQFTARALATTGTLLASTVGVRTGGRTHEAIANDAAKYWREVGDMFATTGEAFKAGIYTTTTRKSVFGDSVEAEYAQFTDSGYATAKAWAKYKAFEGEGLVSSAKLIANVGVGAFNDVTSVMTRNVMGGLDETFKVLSFRASLKTDLREAFHRITTHKYDINDPSIQTHVRNALVTKMAKEKPSAEDIQSFIDSQIELEISRQAVVQSTPIARVAMEKAKQITMQTDVLGTKSFGGRNTRGATVTYNPTFNGWLNMQRKFPVLKILTPFIKTGVNLQAELNETLVNLPGIKQAFLKSTRNITILNHFAQRHAARMDGVENTWRREYVMGKQLMLLGTMFTIWEQLGDTVIGSDVGTTFSERKKLNRSGAAKPYSIRIGETYHDINRFAEPMASILRFSVNAFDSVEAGFTEDQERNALGNLFAAITLMAEETASTLPTVGFKRPVKAITGLVSGDTAPAARFTGALLASLLPSGALVKWFDDNIPSDEAPIPIRESGFLQSVQKYDAGTFSFLMKGITGYDIDKFERPIKSYDLWSGDVHEFSSEITQASNIYTTRVLVGDAKDFIDVFGDVITPHYVDRVVRIGGEDIALTPDEREGIESLTVTHKFEGKRLGDTLLKVITEKYDGDRIVNMYSPNDEKLLSPVLKAVNKTIGEYKKRAMQDYLSTSNRLNAASSAATVSKSAKAANIATPKFEHKVDTSASDSEAIKDAIIKNASSFQQP